MVPFFRKTTWSKWSKSRLSKINYNNNKYVKYLYEGVIVSTALYRAEAWGMKSAERRKVNVLEMKCLRSLVGVSRMDRVRNEEVRR